MKKSVLFRIALVMLVLTMVTSCFVGGTFAKYVTSGQGGDSARVAKFGVAVTANGETFAHAYAKDDSSFTLDANSVVANDGTTGLVAPGTKGNMASMTLEGTPEVAVRVTYEADLALSSNWTVDSKYYCPLIITVEETAINGLWFESAAEFEAAVENAIAAYTNDYKANTTLSSVGGDSLSVSWEWPFYTVNADMTNNDYNDTWLGNQAAAGNPATIFLTVTTTVTQID